MFNTRMITEIVLMSSNVQRHTLTKLNDAIGSMLYYYIGCAGVCAACKVVFCIDTTRRVLEARNATPAEACHTNSNKLAYIQIEYAPPADNIFGQYTIRSYIAKL